MQLHVTFNTVGPCSNECQPARLDERDRKPAAGPSGGDDRVIHLIGRRIAKWFRPCSSLDLGVGGQILGRGADGGTGSERCEQRQI